jgi:hypothetical protein
VIGSIDFADPAAIGAISAIVAIGASRPAER